MFTKASKPYLYPFILDIFPPTAGTGLQYDVYPMSVELNSRFFMNMIHGENVVLEASINLHDLTYIKALKDGTILTTESYSLSDGSVVTGSDLINQVADLLTTLTGNFTAKIQLLESFNSPDATFLTEHVEEPPPPKVEDVSKALSVDVNEIYERLSKRSGRIQPNE